MVRSLALFWKNASAWKVLFAAPSFVENGAFFDVMYVFCGRIDACFLYDNMFKRLKKKRMLYHIMGVQRLRHMPVIPTGLKRCSKNVGGAVGFLLYNRRLFCIM